MNRLEECLKKITKYFKKSTKGRQKKAHKKKKTKIEDSDY